MEDKDILEIQEAMEALSESFAVMAPGLARFYRVFHDELVKQGFTSEEAMTMCKAYNPGAASK